ncbi:S9 family peptidase [Mesobacillus zeae]|uniref:S9 family peptidase n=1 Tax=Mesobacillus zeae TaxID=1917180 RepID=A0A398BFB0_9BACI|nr:S9 family peptidase [Mesobacillus zeae]RID87468.1 S9 family peptidase [Mesobacillus zeae]
MDTEDYIFQEPAASSPVYAPDGQKLRFIADYDGLPQIWEQQGEDGQPVKVTFSKERITLFKYIANSDMAIIGMDAGGDEKQQLFLLVKDKDPIPLTNSPEHVHHYGGSSPDGRWIAWSSNRRHPAYFDIYIQRLDTQEIHPVFTGNGTYECLMWSPDGEYLVIRKTNSPQDNDIGLLHLSLRSLRWLTLHKGEAGFKNPHFSKDASRLYLLTNIGREFYGLASLSLATGEITWLSQGEWDYEGLAMDRDKNRLAFSINEGGISRGIIADLQTGSMVTWDTPMGVINDIVFSADGKKLAFSFSGPAHPQDIWKVDVATVQTERLTGFLRDLTREKELVEPSFISFRSFDSLMIPAIFYRPKQAKKRFPVVVYLHGGPESQARAAYNSFIQHLIEKGYGVCAPNFRGSTGYGKQYTHLDDRRKRMDAVKDLVSLAGWLKAEGGADSTRLSVMGGSYGGFLVLAAVTHYPKIWSAGISIVGISSIRSFLENTSLWRRRHREAEYGTIERDGAFFDAIDPLHYTDRIRCPLMLIHGANDPRVPIGESEQFAAKLKKRKHPVAYIRFEDEGHSLSKMKNKFVAYTRMAQFLDSIAGK